MDADERWSAEWIRQQTSNLVLAFLDRTLEKALLDDPHKPTADILREKGLERSARAIDARNATSPDTTSRRGTTAPAPRTKR
jgi:hypothetical protein